MATIREPALPGGVAAATEQLFAGLSAARGRRIFHPQGMTFGGRLSVEAEVAGVSLFERGATHAVVLRFSRALGTPRGRLDFLGLALRVAEKQDLLLASSAAGPLLRYLPVPARTFAGTTFSSLLPFDAAGRVVLVGARVDHVRTGTADQLAELEQAAVVAPLRATLALAEVGRRWRRVATIDVGDRLPDSVAVAFDPWVCGGGFVPWGRINAVRAPAYRGSRRGRATRLRRTSAASPPPRATQSP